MKNIIFVIGPACSGKSTYINKYYPNYKKVDLYDYQSNSKTIPEILKSYEECKKALIEALKEMIILYLNILYYELSVENHIFKRFVKLQQIQLIV